MPSPLASCALSSNFSGTSTVIFRAVFMICILPYLTPASSMVLSLEGETGSSAVTVGLRISMLHGAVQETKEAPVEWRTFRAPATFQLGAISDSGAFCASRKINKLRVFNTHEYSDPRLHHIKSFIIN